MKTFFTAHRLIFFAILALTGIFGISGTFGDYLNTVKEKSPNTSWEWQFDTKLAPLNGYYGNYQVRNVIVLFDMSASTSFMFKTGKTSGSGRMLPTEPKDSKNEIKTPQSKHVALAELEGLSLVFKYLAQASANNAHLYLAGFSDAAQKPVAKDIGFPHEIKLSGEFNEIAQKLPEIMPTPMFGGTRLSSGLNEVPLAKLQEGNTLLVILTDGQTSDAPQTASMLRTLMNKVTGEGKNQYHLDIITIGAGSIVDKTQKPKKKNSDSNQTLTYAQRSSVFSHVVGTNSSYGGAQCNIGYLNALTAFASPFGKGRYAGAYQDYHDLNNMLSAFFSGLDDGSYILYIQSNTAGKFWSAKSHQYGFINSYLMKGQGEGAYHYEENGFKATILKDKASNLISVTDEQGVKRVYLYEKASLIKAYEETAGSALFTLSSDDDAIQETLNNFNKPPKGISGL